MRGQQQRLAINVGHWKFVRLLRLWTPVRDLLAPLCAAKRHPTNGRRARLAAAEPFCILSGGCYFADPVARATQNCLVRPSPGILDVRYPLPSSSCHFIGSDCKRTLTGLFLCRPRR